MTQPIPIRNYLSPEGVEKIIPLFSKSQWFANLDFFCPTSTVKKGGQVLAELLLTLDLMLALNCWQHLLPACPDPQQFNRQIQVQAYQKTSTRSVIECTVGRSSDALNYWSWL